jgi:predicted metal-dependent phosphoesterase TrpH
MNPRFVDLHMHTDCSDGLYRPSEVLSFVRKAEIVAFSITDHDTLAGYREVRTLLQEGDPELIPGLELSAGHEGVDLHLLAYLFDPEDPYLNSALAEFQSRRNQRAALMVEKLNDLGISIEFEQVAERAGNAAIGRPHIAEVMFQQGQVPTYLSAFDKYIGNGKPAFVPKRNFTPPEAIDAVHKAGGVVILAHPQIDETFRYIEELAGLGLDGIEIYHSAHQQRHIEQFRHLAERFRLACSGGSDFHGREGRHGAIGSQHVPEECLLRLKQRV